MEDKSDNQASYFKDKILFGVKGEYNEVKWMKVYLENNPQAKIYITEREAINQDKIVGQKRKVEVVEYLEIRDKDGDDYNIIAQIRLNAGEVTQNYPIIVASKEQSKEGEINFKHVTQLQKMKNLERGYIKAIHKETEQQGYDNTKINEDFVPVKATTITAETLMTEEQILNAKKNQTLRENQMQSKLILFVNEANRQEIKKQLELFIKNSKDEVTQAKLNEQFDIRPQSEYKQMLSDLCYTTTISSRNVYKLKTK